jgi:hypothetical protein
MWAGCGQEILDVCPGRRKLLGRKDDRRDLKPRPLADQAEAVFKGVKVQQGESVSCHAEFPGGRITAARR